MPTMNFSVHLPLLRITEEVLPFGYGKLWRLPFEAYDRLTLGAFSDHGAAYEETAPVFYFLELDYDWPNLQAGKEAARGMGQMKFRSDDWSLLPQTGLGFLQTVFESFVDPAWAALSLAAPAARLPSPRLSTAFAVPDGDFSLVLPGLVTLGAQLQGDADQEFLFMPAAAAAALSPAEVARAEELLALLYGLRPGAQANPNPDGLHPEVRAALEVLLACAAPPLSGPERLTLAVTALEALLLPEVISGLGSTFARRLGALCGADEARRAELRKTAQKLYAYRSANVHGGGGVQRPSRTLDQAHAQQLLAAAVHVMGRETLDGKAPEALRAALDAGSPEHPALAGLPLADPPGLRPGETLLLPRSPVTTGFASGADMSAAEGSLLGWFPLVGLAFDNGAAAALGEPARAVLDGLSPEELRSMEDRDIRRDFAAGILEAQHSHAVLGALVPSSGDAYSLPDAEVAPLLRTRDLAVTALRLAGLRRFYDPELLGWFVYHGKFRLRRPTIYRQSIVMAFCREPEESLAAVDLPRVSAYLDLLSATESGAPAGAVEHVLRLYRRGFDRRFLPLPARAGLLLSCLEALLGRFRKREDPVQLEDLAAVFAREQAPAAVEWFQSEGRWFRNSVAHGYWQPDAGAEPAELEHLLDLLTALLPAYLNAWLAEPERGRRTPESVFSALGRAKILDSRARG